MALNFKEDDVPINLSPGLYDLQRKYAGPTQYDQIPRPVTADVLESGWIYAAVIIFFSLIVILPGIRLIQSVSAFIRILLGVAILLFIMICNFGQDWESAYIGRTTTAYRAGLPNEINASIGVQIGLRSVNITLKGIPVVQSFENCRVNETINYNERLSWNNEGFVQGRAGFGKYATLFNRDFREHQRKGTPFPILNIAEYFTADGEGLRWGRFYRQAGYFTHIMLWTALPLWIISLVMFNMVVRFGAYFSMMTGVSLLIGNIMYATIRNANKLEIRFPDAVLIFSWGWCFWLCVGTGIVSFLIGLVVVILDIFYPEKLTEFFNVDITQDFEEFYLDPTEAATRGKKSYRTKTIMIANGPKNTSPLSSPTSGKSHVDLNDIELQQPLNEVQQPQRAFRKRAPTLLGPMQKSQKILARPTAAGGHVNPASHGNVAYNTLAPDTETDFGGALNNKAYEDEYDTVVRPGDRDDFYVNSKADHRISKA